MAAKMNPNVKTMLIQSAILGAAESIWTGTVMVAFIYLLSGNSNATVGYVEAAFGLATLASAYPVGYLADKYSKSRVVAVGGVLCVVAAAATSAAAYFAVEEEMDTNSTNATDAAGDDEAVRRTQDWSIWMMGGCMVLWGVASGTVSGPAQALYADSIPAGERSRWYMYLMVTYLVSSMIGPAIAIVLFKVYGDRWHPRELRNVMWAGMVLEVCAAIPMFFFDDKYALKQEGAEDAGDEKKAGVADDSSNPAGGINGDPASEDDSSQKPGGADPTAAKTTWLGLTKRHIPYVLFANDVVVAMGSGMTTKFFPLFFKNVCEYNPSQVQTIFIVVPVSIALFSGVGTFIAKFLGRIYTIILVRMLGISLLLTMAYGISEIEPALLVVIYIFRTGLMNCTYPLEESILMDSVPPNTRARWKSLESISQFGWCGSAVIGGLLSDRYTYSFTFVITAVVQGTGTLLLLLIEPLVPMEKKPELKSKGSGEVAENTTAGNGKELRHTASQTRRGPAASPGNPEATRAPVYEDERTPLFAGQ